MAAQAVSLETRYGLTSLPWVLGVLPFTWGPLPVGMALPLASWLAGLAAIAVMATAVARGAGSTILREWPVAFAAVALPLGLVPIFAAHLTSGMDTTFSAELFEWRGPAPFH